MTRPKRCVFLQGLSFLGCVYNVRWKDAGGCWKDAEECWKDACVMYVGRTRVKCMLEGCVYNVC